ncbi:hypothetical protein SAMN02910456_00071 [Ruminococcaceae bacterium YRB3002]|nr:hypothetical protein SAMN02910456_00071 [Ruminococcaceae bacterium YRB3002]
MSDKAKCILFVSLYAFFMAACKIFLDRLPPDSLIRGYIKLPPYIVLGILALILFREDYKKGLVLWKEHPVKNVLFTAGLIIAKPVLATIASIPGALMYPEAETINDTFITGAIEVLDPVLIILSMGILGPIVEETVFRLAAIGKLSSRVPAVISVILSSLLFMVIHIHAFTVQEFVMNLDKLTTGLLFGTALISTRNITVSTAVHILNNTFGLLLIMLMQG